MAQPRPTRSLAVALALLTATLAAAPAPLRVVATVHYVIHTDVPAADDPLVADLGHRMDVMYDEYVRQLSDFHPAPDAPPLQVYLFAKQARYAAFSRLGGPNSGGVFVGGPHPFLASYLDDQDRTELRQTLQHEAFHQFAYFTVSKHLPVWLNEGLAQVFEEGIWAGDRFLLGQVTPRRVRQTQSDLDRRAAVPVAKLLAISSEGWAATLRRDVNAGESNYNAAWLVAHYLTFGPDADARRRLADLLRALHELDRTGNASDEAIDAAVRAGFPDGPAFQSAFTAWCRRLRPSDEATLLERQKILGDFLSDYRDAGKTFPDVAAFRAAAVAQHLRILYVRGLVRFRTDANPGLYFADLAGRLYSPQQLYFEPTADVGPLPDLVCQATDRFQVRTRFYRDYRGRLGHEASVDTAANMSR